MTRIEQTENRDTDRLSGWLETASDLATRFSARTDSNDRSAAFPYENYQDMHHAGFLALTLPRDEGGLGATVYEAARVLARLAQGDASTGLVMAMHLSNVGRAAELGLWPQHIYIQIVTAVKAGGLVNQCASEAETGSPSRGGKPTTIATLAANGWHISGHKIFTTGAPVLAYFIVTATIQTDEADDPRNGQTGNFLVPRDAPGLRIVETWDSLGMRLTGSHDLMLDDVTLAAEALVGLNSQTTAWQTARSAVWQQLLVAAVYYGIGAAASDYALRYARTRIPNSLDKPISELPHIQDKAGRMTLGLRTAAAILFETAARGSDPHADVPKADMAAAKYLATNGSLDAVDIAMRIVGGASLSMKSPLQRYYRDARAGLHNPPMDDVALAMIGKQALDHIDIDAKV